MLQQAQNISIRRSYLVMLGSSMLVVMLALSVLIMMTMSVINSQSFLQSYSKQECNESNSEATEHHSEPPLRLRSILGIVAPDVISLPWIFQALFLKLLMDLHQFWSVLHFVVFRFLDLHGVLAGTMTVTVTTHVLEIRSILWT